MARSATRPSRASRRRIERQASREAAEVARAMRAWSDQVAQELRDAGFAGARSPGELARGRWRRGRRDGQARPAGERLPDCDRPAREPNALTGTVYRLRRHLLPWRVAAGLYGAAALTWAADWVTGSAWTPHIALGTTAAASLTAGLGLLVKRDERRRSRWRRRILAATWTGVAWLSLAATLGPSWGLTAALLAGTVAYGAGWWRDIRITAGTPQPAEETREEVDDLPADEMAVQWDRTIGAKGGALPGSRLTNHEVRGDSQSWQIRLVRGAQSIDSVRQQLPLIETALGVPRDRLAFEPDPEHPYLVRMTILSRRQIDEVVEWTEPTYREEIHVRERMGKRKEWVEGWLEPGRYIDGGGRVRIPLIGEDSVRNCAFVGGQGSGKSTLMTQMALSAMSSGRVVIWYLDGQDGASSPELLRHADWAPTGPQREQVMVDALERVYAARGQMLKARQWRGWPSTPEHPAIVVVVDECHVFWQSGSELETRWHRLATMGRKVGIAYWPATQYPELRSFFGSMNFRGLMMQWSCVALRTKGGSAKGLLEADVDPSALPNVPGVGIIVGGKAGEVRTAPFRADYLDELAAEYWLERIPCPPLDSYSAHAAGPAYALRHEAAEEARQQLLTSLGDDLEPTFEPGPVSFPAFPNFPAFPDFAPPSSSSESDGEEGPAPSGREAVLAAVRDGAQTARAVQQVTGLSESQVHLWLSRLVDDGAITRPRRGQYVPA